MFTLLIVIILGVGFAFLATQNTVSVPVSFGYGLTLEGIPLYIVALASLLFGVFVSWLISLFDGIGSFFSGYRKNAKIKELEEENTRLRAKNTDLKAETV